MDETIIKPEIKKTLPWRLALIFLLFSAAIILTGGFYYKSQRNRIIREEEDNLSGIEALKISQIESWRTERLGDASVIRRDRPLIRSISDFLYRKNSEVKIEIFEWMESLINQYDYKNVLIADTSLKVKLSIVPSDTILGDSIRKELKASLKSHSLLFTDFHKSKEISYIHLDMLIPLFKSVNKNQEAIGVVILRINPEKILYPLIQSWPTQSKSSETLLLRSEGDSVLYLNELRHAKNTALKLKRPLTNKNLLATKAVDGFEGVTEGIDYRNIPVIGSIQKISETPWYMVAKVDKDEILMPLKRYSNMIIMVVILLILINASIFGFWIWQQRIKFYKSQLKNEDSIHELEERFTTAFRMSPVSVTISKMADNKFIDVNNTFLKDMEYNREEVIGRTAKELNIWADENERLWIINELSEKGKVFGKVIRYKTRTGKILYGLSSMSVVKVNGGPCNLSTVVNITESRKSEEKLIESEELFRELFENMLNGFAYCKMICEDGNPLDFIYLNVNEAFAALTGLKDVMGKRVSEVIPGIQEADPELLERYNRVSSSGIPEVFETYVESLKMWFAISVYSTQKGYFVAVFDVITARKLAEQKLQESRATLQSIIDNSNSLIYIIDAEGRFVLVNKPLQTLFSLAGEKLIGQSRDVFLPKEIADIHRKNDLVVIKTGKTQVFEEENIEPDGKHYYLTTKFPLFNNQNEIYGVGGLSTDITERKLAENAIRENEKRLQEAQEMAHLGFWLWDIKTGGVEWSEEVFKIFCLNPETFTPKIDSILELSPWPEDHQRDKELIARAMETHTPGDYEQKFLRPDKSIGYYYSTFRGNYDDGGELISIVGTVLDITERNLAEDALRESEDKFKYVFDHSLIPKSITLPSGEINVNRAFCEMLGYQPEELKRINWAEISHPDDIKLTNDSLNLILSGEKDSVRFNKRYIHKNGSVVWADVGTSLRRDDYNNPQYFMTSVTDITERMAAEEALRESEERFSKSFKTSPISFIIANMEDGRIIEINDAFTGISGFTREEAIGNTTLNMKIWVHEEDRKHMIDSLRKGKAILHKETMLRAKDGNISIVLLSAQVIKLGNRNCIISSIEDITKRKEAEAEVRIQSEIMSHMAEAVYLVRMEDGIIVYTNSRFEELFGYGQGEMTGKHVSIVNAPTEKSSDQTAAEIMNDLDRNGYWAGEVLNIKKDGTVFWSHAHVAIFDHSKFGRVLVSVQEDITDRKNAELQIIMLNEELERRVIQRTELLEAANKELEAFSYSVSHDLRAPLRSVHGYTRILVEEYENKLDEEGIRICGIISSSATKMGELIDDLLNFSRIGRTSMNPSQLDMKSIVKSIFEEICPDNQKSKTNLKIGKLHKAFGDANLLRMVWNNLISNAIKYSSKNVVSEISIGSKVEGNLITYFIKDNGVGFDMQYAHKLFGVFQRLHSEAEFEGNGVGLAIVQRIIIKHGGKVWADGEEGKGATFYFSLPVEGNRQRVSGDRHKPPDARRPTPI
jgi:PAS domain S-box-containing protein